MSKSLLNFNIGMCTFNTFDRRVDLYTLDVMIFLIFFGLFFVLLLNFWKLPQVETFMFLGTRFKILVYKH